MSTIHRLCGTVVAVLAVLFGTSADASAGFIFTAQNRFVTGQLGGNLGGAGPQTITAPDFGLFDRTVSLTVPTYGGGATQHQRSQLLGDLITVIGDGGVGRPAEVGTGWASTRSYTDVKFDLADATDVTLSASGIASGSGIPIHEIKLFGPGQSTVVRWDAFNSGTLFPQGSGSRSSSFTLAAGSYEFIVDMQSYDSSIISNNHHVSNFNVALAIPEPASAGAACAGLFALTAALTTRRRRRRLI